MWERLRKNDFASRSLWFSTTIVFQYRFFQFLYNPSYLPTILTECKFKRRGLLLVIQWMQACQGEFAITLPQKNPFPFIIRNSHRTQQMKESALAIISQQSIYWLPIECKTVCWFLSVDNRIKCQPPRCINLRQGATHTHTEMWEKDSQPANPYP